MSPRTRVVCALALAGLALLATSAEAQRPEDVFDAGYNAYAEGRYEDAARAFAQLTESGVRDARVEFNLGNAQFKLGRIGPAILHFERARRLAPTDREVRDNLAYARSFLIDRVETPELPWILERGRELQNRLGPDTQAWIGLGLVWLLAFTIAWPLASPGRSGSHWAWSSAALAVTLILVVLSWRQTFRRLEGRQVGVVLAPVVEVLAGPGSNNASLDTVHEGLTVEVRDVRESWVQVSLPNGLSGWLPRPSLGLV